MLAHLGAGATREISRSADLYSVHSIEFDLLPPGAEPPR
jgi:hypothetical protein